MIYDALVHNTADEVVTKYETANQQEAHQDFGRLVIFLGGQNHLLQLMTPDQRVEYVLALMVRRIFQ